jgi:hypothetical protein
MLDLSGGGNYNWATNTSGGRRGRPGHAICVRVQGSLLLTGFSNSLFNYTKQ